MKKGVFWLVLCAIFCAPVAFAELYLRSVGLGDPILFYASASYRFAPQPNQKRIRRRGAAVTIDGKGFRSTRDWSDKADGKILFVGDSVTWGGTYVDDSDTFAEGVCQRMTEVIGRSFICGNTGANGYGTDNMAERIRYKRVDDEAALVVTLIAPDTVRGLADGEGQFLFMRPPPAPVRALWEATTYVTFRLYHRLRPRFYRADDELRVAERSLQNLFSAIRETQRAGRKVLIVLSPIEDELHGRESVLTKHVQATLATSGFDVLDLHQAVTQAVNKGFYYDGVHLEVRGHHFYADEITRRLAPLMGESSAERGRSP